MIVFQRFLVRRSGKEGDVGRLSVWSEMGCVNTAGNDSVAVAKKRRSRWPGPNPPGQGRGDEQPPAGVIDSQSRKATENTSLSGYDAGIRIKGCKRHIITDTCGNLIAGEAHGTNIQDRDGAPGVMTRHHREAPKPRRMFAPGGYGGPTLRGAATRPLLAAGGDCRAEEKTEATIHGNGPRQPRGERPDLRCCPD